MRVWVARVVFSVRGFHESVFWTWNSSTVLLLRGSVRCTRYIFCSCLKVKITSAAFTSGCRLITSLLLPRASPNRDHVIASSNDDLPAPLCPEMHATSNVLK